MEIVDGRQEREREKERRSFHTWILKHSWLQSCREIFYGNIPWQVFSQVLRYSCIIFLLITGGSDVVKKSTRAEQFKCYQNSIIAECSIYIADAEIY